jgi:type IV secretory pathway VirB10-like protein
MKIIMKFFTCEGRFPQIYAYHIRLLMHFTRTKLINIPFFLHKSIEKMASIV